MSPQLDTVLQISAIGTTLLFGALAGLIGLMYLLTGSWLSNLAATPANDHDPSPVVDRVDTRAEEEEELDRQHRAVALAVAVACAHSERPSVVVAEVPSDWRRMHHARRLGQQTARAKMSRA